MRIPIPGYAVVHERGTVLFDTGLHEPLIHSSDELGALAALYTAELTPDDLAEVQLARAGIDPGSVTHVVNSHLHFDHCGRNGPFPHAVTLVQAAEWEAAQHPTKYAYVGVPRDEIAAGDLRLVDGAVDLFGDGTVVLVPTPGHTVGHQSLLVRASTAADADAALLVGDACYLRRMLTARVTPDFAIDVAGQLASVRDAGAPRGRRRPADLLPRHRRVGRRAGRPGRATRRLTSRLFLARRRGEAQCVTKRSSCCAGCRVSTHHGPGRSGRRACTTRPCTSPRAVRGRARSAHLQRISATLSKRSPAVDRHRRHHDDDHTGRPRRPDDGRRQGARRPLDADHGERHARRVRRGRPPRRRSTARARTSRRSRAAAARPRSTRRRCGCASGSPTWRSRSTRSSPRATSSSCTTRCRAASTAPP